MGGHKGGEIASKAAIAHFCGYIKGKQPDEGGHLDLMISAAHDANINVLAQAEDDSELSGMGTTFTACTIDGGKCFIAHIGDSRAYAVTKSALTQLTNDHSYVSEMVRAGQITQTEAREHPKRNILTKVLGIDREMSADGYIFDIEPDSFILLCSDGLYNMVPEDEIKKIINTSGEPAAALVEAANARGGTDNISVVVINCNEVIP
jgi:protein phosphatase